MLERGTGFQPVRQLPQQKRKRKGLDVLYPHRIFPQQAQPKNATK
jgi:hypothetical protein